MRLRKLISPKLISRLSAATHISNSARTLLPCTYVLWDLDEGEGVLGGLCWQGPDAEGRGDGGQTSGRHNFSLREEERRTKIRPDIAQFPTQSSWFLTVQPCILAFVFLLSIISPNTVACLWWWLCLSKHDRDIHLCNSYTKGSQQRLRQKCLACLVRIQIHKTNVYQACWKLVIKVYFQNIWHNRVHQSNQMPLKDDILIQNIAHTQGCKSILNPVMCLFFLDSQSFLKSGSHFNIDSLYSNCERRTGAIS